MDKYNCGTCTHACQGINGDGWGENMACADGEKTRFDPEPQHMHPCEHGQPVVATAIAKVEFQQFSCGLVNALHKCENGIGAEWFLRSTGEWDKWRDHGKFCKHCGRLLPTASELPAMYEDWKEQEGKG